MEYRSKPTNIIAVIQPVVLVFVVGLITSIIAPGFVVILPALDPIGSPLHVLRFCFGMWLAFNTILNFLASVLKPAGAVKQYSALHSGGGAGGPDDSATPRAPRNAYMNHSFCERCRDHKPPNAHHCSVCKGCVVGMDHHCIFVNNCVGTRNMRHFILFLFWTVAACAYVSSQATLLLYRRWYTFLDFLVETVRTLHRRPPLVVGFRALWQAPVWLSVTLYLVCMSSGLAVGLSFLLCRQLVLLVRGVSFIDSMQLQSRGYTKGMAGSPMTNLRRIFGGGHPLLWPLPCWNATPAAVPSRNGNQWPVLIDRLRHKWIRHL